MQPLTPGIPTTPRLAPKRLGIAALIVGAALFGMVLMSLLHRQQAAVQPPAPPLPPLYEVQGEVDAFQRLRLTTSWAGEDRTPPKPPPLPQAPPVLPPPPPLFPAQPQMAALPPLPAVPPPPAPVVPVPPLQAPVQASTPSPAATPAKAPPPPAPPAAKPGEAKDSEWLFAEVKRPGKPQGDTSSAQGSPGASGRHRQSQLFPPAGWERPARPERVLYASQIMQCLLEQSIRTGHDGTVRCRVTETVYDKFGQLETLVPLHSLILGTVAGANVKAGQSAIPITVTKVELPDGTDLPLTGKMGSADGQSAVPGTVDNRIPQAILSAVLSAITSIGTRSITGSTSGYQPNLGQEFTADAAQSLSRSGQKMVERTLSLDPVIWVKAQTPVTVQLSSNISLQSAPIIVHR